MLPALGYGVSETDNEWRLRAAREAEDRVLLSFRCADLLEASAPGQLIAWQTRRGTPSLVPWHLLLIGMWVVAWCSLSAHRARSALHTEHPRRRDQGPEDLDVDNRHASHAHAVQRTARAARRHARRL